LLPLIYFTVLSTPEIYTLSLHDALPILKKAPESIVHPVILSIYNEGALSVPILSNNVFSSCTSRSISIPTSFNCSDIISATCLRSEEHTSELQSRFDLVCRLLLD